MDIYFNILGFEEKVKKIFNEFSVDNSLVLSSSGQNFVFIDKSNPTTLQGACLNNLTDVNSAWLSLKISDNYCHKLIENLYQGLDVQKSRYLEALNKHITKTFKPEDVSSYLYRNKENQLEYFLLSKKTQFSIGWSSPKVFEYITKIFKDKSNYEKTIALHTILRNNKWDEKSINMKSVLQEFVNLNIEEKYRFDFNKYYELFQKNYNEKNTFFNTPKNVFIIEINKTALYSQIILEEKSTVMNDKLHEEMLKNLSKILNSKKVAKKLGIINFEITQNLSKFSQLRLIFDAVDIKSKDEENMKIFLNLYFECYDNKFKGFIPNKQNLLSMVDKILLNIELEENLIKKEKLGSRINKI